INDGALFTNKIGVQLTISAKPHTAEIQVSNDGGFGDAVWEPYSTQIEWQITRYRGQEITRLVYVRFRDVAGNVSATYLDDIILDVKPPEGDVSLVQSAQGLELALLATDDVSGVDSMRLSASPNFEQTSWEPYTPHHAWDFDAAATVYVQFSDNAGNVSATYLASAQQGYRIALPLVYR
ncbi:MAG TPA: hypothetical protein VFX76_18815, partial [Roseiflexaceae bacterium]|nr:hypothetical protein [Roseiflexaceae bacterium]